MKYFKYAICGVIIGIINGVFASGGGVLAVLFLDKVIKLEKKKSHASAILIILPISIMSIFFYTKGGYADFPLILKTSVGGVVGGFLGARLLNKLEIKIIKRIFGFVLIFAGIRMFLR